METVVPVLEHRKIEKNFDRSVAAFRQLAMQVPRASVIPLTKGHGRESTMGRPEVRLLPQRGAETFRGLTHSSQFPAGQSQVVIGLEGARAKIQGPPKRNDGAFVVVELQPREPQMEPRFPSVLVAFHQPGILLRRARE